MGTTINFYLKDVTPLEGVENINFWNKVVFHLRRYMKTIADRSSKQISSIDIWYCAKDKPSLLETDIVVYVVPDIDKSVIQRNGGSVAKAEANPKILGLTDQNLKICEVYLNRAFQRNPKEIAGAAYHEAAHLKSNLDDAMHKQQDGFLKASPDYLSSPTTKNADFFVQHILQKVQLQWRRIPLPR